MVTKTQPFEPGLHPGEMGARRVFMPAVTGEVMVPELVVTVTEVGLLIQGHQAKYQPFWTVAVTVSPLANAKLVR